MLYWLPDFKFQKSEGVPPALTVSRAQLLLPFPRYTSVALSNADTGSARYYSFYFRAQRRFASGLSLPGILYLVTQFG
jgi:hypothetical protein